MQSTVAQLVECKTRDEGSLVRDSPLADSLCCFLEHDFDFIHCLVLVQLRKTGNRPDITEKLLTGMQGIKTKAT